MKEENNIGNASDQTDSPASSESTQEVRLVEETSGLIASPTPVDSETQKPQEKTGKDIVLVSQDRTIFKSVYALEVTGRRVQSVSGILHWKPETLIRRIKTALPAVVEQQLYLHVGGDFRIQPESLAKLLRSFLGSYELQPDDFFSVSVGNNLVKNKFADVADFLEGALTLLDKVSIDYAGFTMSMEDAAELVKTYGPEGAESIIDSIAANIDHIAPRLNAENRSFERAMGIAIGFLVDVIIPDNRSSPAVLDMLEYFQDTDGLLRAQMRRATGKDEE